VWMDLLGPTVWCWHSRNVMWRKV